MNAMFILNIINSSHGFFFTQMPLSELLNILLYPGNHLLDETFTLDTRKRKCSQQVNETVSGDYQEAAVSKVLGLPRELCCQDPHQETSVTQTQKGPEWDPTVRLALYTNGFFRESVRVSNLV